MKNIYTGFLLWVFGANLLASTEGNFTRANQLYKQQDFEQALALYNDIPVKDAATLYNLGNCSYCLGKFTDALVCWRKAQSNADAAVFSDCAHNVAVLESQLASHTQPWQIGLFHLLGRLSCALPLLILQLLFLLCWLMLIMVWSRLYRAKRYISLVFLGLTTFVLSIILILICIVKTQSIGIVTQQQSIVFTGPDEQFHVLGELQEGDEVLIKYREDKWYKVQGKNIVGWVLCDTLELID